MSLDDWILALHVLSAFAMVGAMVLFTVVFVALRSAGAEGLAPVVRVGTVAVAVGSLGTLVFGTWLALSVGGYDLWDGWIIAAFVLWLIGVGTGSRSGTAMAAGDLRMAVRLHTISSIAVLLILADMIWKPGA